MSSLPVLPLPAGVRSRRIENVNGLSMHVLEAGFERAGRPLALLLHGFPELAYSWRKVMIPLAAEGFHVVAPDQRGYGRTIGWSDAYDQDLRPFSALALVDDTVALVTALGYPAATLLVGHDFGSPVAAWCALTRPDAFQSVVMMSAPFAGPPALAAVSARPTALDEALAKLSRPRKHYHSYYATRAANADMMQAPDGLHAFLRAYFHYKSADWAGNAPHKLDDWSAEQLAVMPTYYIMDRGATMAETVAPYLPSQQQIAACVWMPDAEMAVYASEYGRTGFQGGLNWYRTRFNAALNDEQAFFGGRTINVPSMFISGARDWGTYQAPGAFERMQTDVCTAMQSADLIADAGHWVMQEQPEQVTSRLVAFARRNQLV